jgi:hypothetical protein
MVDITLNELYRRILANREAPANLIDAAAGVANAIAVGAGGFIVGTLMEDEFRKALCLRRDELVNIPKPTHSGKGDVHER